MCSSRPSRGHRRTSGHSGWLQIAPSKHIPGCWRVLAPRIQCLPQSTTLLCFHRHHHSHPMVTSVQMCTSVVLPQIPHVGFLQHHVSFLGSCNNEGCAVHVRAERVSCTACCLRTACTLQQHKRWSADLTSDAYHMTNHSSFVFYTAPLSCQ